MNNLALISFVLWGCTKPGVESEELKAKAVDVNKVEAKEVTVADNITSPDKLLSTSTTPALNASLVSRNILPNVEILIPRGFGLRDKKMRNLKYPLKEATSFQVYTNEDGDVNIAV